MTDSHRSTPSRGAAPARPFAKPACAGATRRNGASACTAWLAIGLAVLHAGGSCSSPSCRKGYSAFVQTRISARRQLRPGGDRSGGHARSRPRRPAPTTPALVREALCRRAVPGGRPAAPSGARSATSSATAPASTLRSMVHGRSDADRHDARPCGCSPSTDIDMLAKGNIGRDGAGGRPARSTTRQIAWYRQARRRRPHRRTASTPPSSRPATAASRSWPASGRGSSARF